MKRLRHAARRLLRAQDGVAAVEMGLLAPLLLFLLLMAVEMARLYQAYREFDNGVVGLARALAGVPEYDSRARQNAPYIAAALLPPDWNGKFNFQVTSLQKNNGAMSSTFTDTLFGANPNLPYTAAVDQSAYDQSESVIFFSASYRYTPMFSVFSKFGYTMTKTYALNPYFSRAYIKNAGQSADKYVY